LTVIKRRRRLAGVNVTIREARADDAEFLAWVMLTAARSHLPLCFWDLAIPGPEKPRLEIITDLARSEAPTFLRFDGFLIAEQDGRPVAGISAYDSAHKSLDAFVKAAHETLTAREWSPAHFDLLLRRMGPATACMPDSPPGTWVLEWVAAKPEVRGKGVARELLSAILENGRGAGYENAQIAYIIGNDPARAAYERVGFATVEELRDPGFEAALGAPGIARMTMRL
jgi:GNAT superfamily N-acetyltransferase